MAYDEELSHRIRKAVARRRGVSEKEMFGGIAFLLDGKMFIGIVKDELMVRVGPERYEDALDEPEVRPMTFTGRPMKGYVYVGPAGCRSDAAVAKWAERAMQFVATLPAPKKKARKPIAKKTVRAKRTRARRR